MKLTVVGGGSYNWMHTLINDLCLCPFLDEGTIMLYDINPQNLKDVHGAVFWINQQRGGKFDIQATTERARALEGADLVVVTISTGGLDAMEHDLKLPEKYGIYQSVGDSVGPGGLSRAWRNVPVFVDLAQAMQRYCPDAWMLNLTNPMTVLTASVLATSKIKAVGLCHEMYGTLEYMARVLGAEDWRKDFQVRCAGVNHFLWVTELTYRGQDGLKLLREAIDDSDRMRRLDGKGLPMDTRDIGLRTSILDKHKFKFEMLRRFGVLPTCGDRHLVEFVPFALTERCGYGKEWGVELTSVESRRTGLAQQIQYIREVAAGKQPLRPRSIESFPDIVAALLGGPVILDVLNRPNFGQVANLPRGAVLECQVVISRDRIDPVTYGALPDPILALMGPVVTRQQMTLRACLDRDENLARQILMTDPLIHDYHDAMAMWTELREANKQFLPVSVT